VEEKVDGANLGLVPWPGRTRGPQSRGNISPPAAVMPMESSLAVLAKRRMFLEMASAALDLYENGVSKTHCSL